MKTNESKGLTTNNKGEYIATDLTYLEKAALLDQFKEFKLITFKKMNISEGQKILDMGCGTGNVVLELSNLIGPNGEAIGVDINEDAIKSAMSKIDTLNSNVKFSVQNAENLSFPDNYFDSCRSERVFQHLLNPEKALQEMKRVTKPNGNIVIGSPDWGTLTVNSDYKATTKFLIEEYIMNEIHEPWIGRKLFSFFSKANLKNIAINPFVFVSTDLETSFQAYPLDAMINSLKSSNKLSEKEASDWLEDVQTKDKNGTFFSSIVGFVVSGTK